MEKYEGVQNIHFLDDILTLRADWFREFAERYRKAIGRPYTCNTRYDLLNEEYVGLLKDSGCVQIGLGLESGDDFIRREVLKRNQSEERILKATALIRAAGLKFSVYTMVGIPNETPVHALRTVKLTARLRPNGFQTSIYYPYPRTKLYDLCQRHGYLTGQQIDSYFDPDTTLALPTFPKCKILFAYENFADFVQYYSPVLRLPRLLRFPFEKLLDYVWLHSDLYRIVRPPLQGLAWCYRKARGTARRLICNFSRSK